MMSKINNGTKISRQESISVQTQLKLGVPVGGVPAHSEQVGDLITPSSSSYKDVISAGMYVLP